MVAAGARLACFGGGGGLFCGRPPSLTPLVLLVLPLGCCLLAAVDSFNVHLRSVVVHDGPNASMFGFSVAQYRSRGVSWLLVGAPTAQTRQPQVIRGGSVFRCSVEKANDCQEIIFDRNGPRLQNNHGNQEPIEEKSGQWFGATLHSSRANGVVVACAPRYVYFSSNFRRREPVGTCYVARNSLTDFQEYSPCRTIALGYHRQGFCQAGFSAVLTPDNRRLFIGAVGSWYWQGQIFVQDLFSRSDLLSTSEGPAFDDDSYLGYAAAVGEFSGDDKADVAMGMPRGRNLTGKVTLYSSSLENLYNISGEQMGSYFGYSLAVADLNGDGLDDVIVGAPFFSNLNSKDTSYETGRVYIYYQNEEHEFSEWHFVNGKVSKARFGLALTTLNDINKDGFEDFAVGAPYGGKFERGAIFIYHGSKDGVIKTPSQVIHAEDINPTLKTFGFSLSGGMDLDNNEYPDLLVGAYDSNTVALFKTRPVVTVTSSLNVNPAKINLDDQGCSLLDGTVVSCVLVYTCLEYTGVGVPTKLEFELVVQLDVTKEKGPRVFFLTSERDHVQPMTAILQKDSMYCKSNYIYIKTNIQDKLTPVLVVVNYSVIDRHPNSNELKPILNQYLNPVLKKQINIQKNCGKDNICIPDLQVTANSLSDSYLIGSHNRLELEVNVTNFGEDAFEARFYLEIPTGVDYVNINSTVEDQLISCSHPSNMVNFLYCDIGNPLKANKIIKFKVILLPKYLNSTDNEYEFIMEVNSTNPENVTTEYNNIGLIRVPVSLRTDLRITGVSLPHLVSYNKTILPPDNKVTEEDIGPEIVHLYDVWNKGPSPIMEVEIHILWPTYTVSGQHLLYLVQQPEAIGLGRCEYLRNVNPLNVTVGTNGASAYSSLNVVNMDDLMDEKKVVNYETTKRKTRSAEDFRKELSCGPIICSKISCTVHSLGKGDHAYFKIRSRLWTKTMKMLGFEELKISSKLIARIVSLPYAVNPEEYDYKTYMINTIASPSDSEYSRRPIPWWIIGAAVCGGILILSVVILILWKVGFFKRKRPGDETEREPLNKPERNGKIVNGDEFL